MAPKKEGTQFTPEETQRRFEAALRGARIAGHKPMTALKADPPPPQKKSKTGSPKRKRSQPHR